MPISTRLFGPLYNEIENNIINRRYPMENEETVDLDNDQLQLLQKEKFDQQDKYLDEILQGTQRLNVVGCDITMELDRHHQVIENIDYEMDKAENKLATNTKQIDTVSKKSKDTIYCIIMILLLVVIVVLLVY